MPRAVQRPARRLPTSWGALVVVVAMLLAACGSGEGAGPDRDDDPSDTTEAAEAEPYLPVPDGVTLTEEGTELDVGDEAVVAWEPRQERVGVLEVKVDRLERTSWRASFDGWQIDEKTRTSMTPYFAHGRITNVGDTDVGDQAVPLYGLDSEGDLIESSKFRDRFGPCPGNGIFPKKFAPDANEKVCLVYLVEQGRRLRGVSFRPTQEFEQIAWTGTIDKPGKQSEKKKTRKKQRGDR